MADGLVQVLLLLGTCVAIILACLRLHIPTSLGYLLVGVLLGPFTMGPAVDLPQIQTLAEFGVVFLLFTIGLNYSLPQINALRGQLLKLGLIQVFVGTALVTCVLGWAGVPWAMAFVVGAVFAQSSSTLIGTQLTEQGEMNAPAGRLGLAMSVFQDVTAVPFLIVIPVLAVSVQPDVLAGTLGLALAKATLAFVAVVVISRKLLRPLFHLVTRRQSLELFTLAALLVVLAAAWGTQQLGLSLAFGAFLAGMMLGETEFRHQMQSTIRPFRDVLLGLFFIGVGMLFDPSVLPSVWHWALLGTAGLLLSKILLVVVVVRASGFDLASSWRTALIVAVGGEFGLALLAIALENDVITPVIGQVLLLSVLFSLVLGAVLIKFNLPLSQWLSRLGSRTPETPTATEAVPEQHVLLGGYGRVGHTIAVLLKAKGIPFVAYDTDPARVAQGQADGHAVYYGNLSDPELLSAIQAEKASLVIMTTYRNDFGLHATRFLRERCPHIPIIARAHDLNMATALHDAGATHAYPEAIEASLRLATIAMDMLSLPREDIDQLMTDVRSWDYQPVLDPEGKA